MDINKAIIVGRLTRDPEMRVTPSGINVATLSIATNFVYKNQEGQKTEQVEYHSVVVWRKLAEIATQYLKKGRRVLIEGRLQTRSWEANDGSKRQKTEIVADNLIMLDGGGGARNITDRSSEPTETPTETPAEVPAETPVQNKARQNTSEEISVEDIPF